MIEHDNQTLGEALNGAQERHRHRVGWDYPRQWGSTTVNTGSATGLSNNSPSEHGAEYKDYIQSSWRDDERGKHATHGHEGGYTASAGANARRSKPG